MFRGFAFRRIVAPLALALTASANLAQSTAFTYQGDLEDSGLPAAGTYDMRFKLFPTAFGGAQVGATQCVDNVPVTEGRFTAMIDFGQQFASTSSRYLEIEVRRDSGLACASGAGFTTLSTRQQITPAPIAAHANAAFALDAPDGSPIGAVYVNEAGWVGVGTLSPLSLLHIDQATDTNTDVIIDSGLTAPRFSALNFFDRGVNKWSLGKASDNNFFIAEANVGIQLTMAPGGNVGIGAPPNLSKLYVNGAIGVPPTTRYTTVHGSAFTPSVVNSSVFEYSTFYSGETGVTGWTQPVDYFAPIQLPDGAVITEFAVYYVNELPNISLHVQLRRSPLMSTGATEIVARVESGPGSGTIQTMSTTQVSGATVNNSAYVYHLQALMNGSNEPFRLMRLKAVRVKYTVTSPLP